MNRAQKGISRDTRAATHHPVVDRAASGSQATRGEHCRTSTLELRRQMGTLRRRLRSATAKCLQRVRLLQRSQLNRKNKIWATNTDTLSVIRKLLTMYGR